jgi:septum formation protein
MDRIILASESPRRKKLLADLGINFDIIPSKINENISNFNIKPEELASSLAYRKAKNVADSLKYGLVIGADTIVSFSGEIFGKPISEEDAFNTLKKLSGKVHDVITGMAIINAKSKEFIIDYEISKVKFSNLSTERIRAYINSKEPFGKAGSYAIQGKGSIFVKRYQDVILI